MDLIRHLDLKRHPEGGYYRQTYKSTTEVSLPQGERAVGSAIYYYLESNDFSAWHRLRSDELLHHYAGDRLIIYVIDHDGKLQHLNLGNPIDTQSQAQILVPAGHWFAAEVDHKSSYSLIGCTVFPGFEFLDCEIATKEYLLTQYPQHADIIRRLTRDS